MKITHDQYGYHTTSLAGIFEQGFKEAEALQERVISRPLQSGAGEH